MLILLFLSPPRQLPAETIRLTEWSGFVEVAVTDRLESRNRTSESSSPGTEQLELRESIQVLANGYVYHPNFFKFAIGPLISFEQIRHSTPSGDSATDSDNFLGGDVRFTFLEARPFTTTLFAVRREDLVPRPFATSWVRLSEVYGATANWRNRWFPINLFYTHTDLIGQGVGVDLNDTTEEFGIHSDYDIGPRSRGDLEYRRFKRIERARNRLTDTQWALFTNTTFFDEGRARLHTTLNARDQGGDFDIRSLDFLQGLNWAHTQSLASFYRGNYRKTDYSSGSTENYGLRAEIRHHLYESLRSSFALQGNRNDSPSAIRSLYGATLNEHYTKRLGAWGKLAANLNLVGTLLDQEVFQDEARIFDEPVTLPGTLPVELAQPDVVPGSLVVTDLAGLIIYEEDLDYVVIVRGRTTSIARLALGDIPDGATVLADYEYALGGDRQIATTGGNLEAHLFYRNYLEAYAGYTQSDQRLLSGTLDTPLEHLKRWLVGFRFTWKNLTGGMEYTDRKSVISPSVQTLQERISWSTAPNRKWVLRLGADHSTLLYTDTDETIRTIRGAVSFQSALARRMWLDAGVEFRQERWSQQGALNDLDAYDIRLKYEWFIRALAVEVSLRRAFIDRSSLEEERYWFQVLVRRQF